jgi:hypothetical protein
MQSLGSQGCGDYQSGTSEGKLAFGPDRAILNQKETRRAFSPQTPVTLV